MTTTKATEIGTKTRDGRSTREAILEAASRLIHVHGFFCEERAAYHPDAATDAWTKLLEWLSKYMNRRSSSK